ncbi:ABC transporter permease subunit [Chengkuizengella sp. SCS-71B]|uniref:ABC transporter permease n=1 Tax=Chengkuizengella sp. SCS-71B TaxID=3115290 RepID=UPI0032C21150
MINIYPLVRNEVLKIWKKKRFFVIVVILAVLIPIFTYAQLRVALNVQKQMGTEDWRIVVQQQIQDYENRVSSPRLQEEWKRWYIVEIQRLQLHLDQNIDPRSPNGVTFTNQFVANSVGLFLPLLVLVIVADLVAGEHSSGTIKLLLTRPIKRWKVLLSKYIALTMYVSITVLLLAVMSYLISGLVFGFGGWMQPVLTGFEVIGSELNLNNINIIPQWQFLIMELGLAWFSSLVVACLAMMVSVLVRSIAAGMGIMLATLIAGTILTNMVSSWESAKYFFMVNLQTVSYLSGAVPPIQGLTLSFSLINLSVWTLISIVISFVVFTKRDILN